MGPPLPGREAPFDDELSELAAIHGAEGAIGTQTQIMILIDSTFQIIHPKMEGDLRLIQTQPPPNRADVLKIVQIDAGNGQSSQVIKSRSPISLRGFGGLKLSDWPGPWLARES